MAENINITCSIKNESRYVLTLTEAELTWGKFQEYPTSSIEPHGGMGSFKASGRKDSASGTEGHVTYRAPTNTDFIFEFEINWGSQANSVRHRTDGQNIDAFVFERTESDFETVVTGSDPGSSPVYVYYVIRDRV